MASFDIPMIPEGEDGNAYRCKLPDGQKFQSLLMSQGNHGTAVKSRARIVKVASGTYTATGDKATLLVFEFQFQTPRVRRRFTNAEIIVQFEDASSREVQTGGNHRLDPVVSKILPQGDFALNKGTSTSSVTEKFDAEVNGGWEGIVDGKLGYAWELEKNVSQDHYASLSGTPSNQRKEGYGEDNAAIWWLDEDPETKQGIPRFLRTAVLVRLPHPGPFCVSLIIKTGVDWVTDMLSFWGIGQRETIDPVTVDSELKLGSEDDGAALTEMGKMDLADCVKVAFVTPLDSV
ncbi:hypothetical protein QQS21_011265 [Conoideocrella luteorostrata]|uniref:Uncharacterized protein n=1 Tax=Conoideocrella luteorostrata TaxID=1105319 RepID=A0AAJ0CHZ1_9HYPO|nr:hypothetical protein QQS21_011265 [Conoideocrella luteorostrata]